MLDGDDRVEKPEGVIAQPSQPEHPVIKGFSEYPFFLGYNRAIAKENAEVVLTINNDPLPGIDVHDLESAKRAAEAIHNKGVKNTVITLGSKGSLAFDGKKFIHSPAFPAVVKNTAGAGDAFNGALASGLAKGKSLESALCYASAFASLAVETSNASDMPEHESVIHRIQSIHYQQTIFTH